VEATEAHERGVHLREGLVPAAFRIAEVDGELVGRTSIRFALNDYLAAFGGHIGYVVLPAHRRRGYATEILRQSLVIAGENGVDRVLLTTDDTNVGSATVIERCGGVLEAVVPDEDGHPMRRYWIQLGE
jgi:predicted acetyltransferase